MKHACQYAVIRFMPDIDAGEFANVGVVLFCPKTGYFDYRTSQQTNRIHAFFSPQSEKIFLKGIQDINAELKRVQNRIELVRFEDKQQASNLFQELIREREGIFQYSKPGVVLTDSPAEKTEHLFARYVEKRTEMDWTGIKPASSSPVALPA